MGKSGIEIERLLAESGLPGPRGNLALLYEFAASCSPKEAEACLKYIKADTGNSPEEFVGMCGVLGWAVANRADLDAVFAHLTRYASHASWRIREAVAMAIQEVGVEDLAPVLTRLAAFAKGNPLEMRAVVAGLCEPKLLTEERTNIEILGVLGRITDSLRHGRKLSDDELSLRKALGYGWSVVVWKTPGPGKQAFEALLRDENKNLRWIARENLKKDRLRKMDAAWVEEMTVLSKEMP